jgi:hypothetical protein
VRDFGAHAFDVIASRTGTMFFTDMAMAFTNLARATCSTAQAGVMSTSPPRTS